MVHTRDEDHLTYTFYISNEFLRKASLSFNRDSEEAIINTKVKIKELNADKWVNKDHHYYHSYYLTFISEICIFNIQIRYLLRSRLKL